MEKLAVTIEFKYIYKSMKTIYMQAAIERRAHGTIGVGLQ